MEVLVNNIMGQGEAKAIINSIVKNPIPVGSGGYGNVYTSETNPKLAVKISKEHNCSREWMREFSTQKIIGEGWRASFPEENEYLEVVQVFDIIQDEKCYILMERICPLINGPLISINGKTAHALIGDFELEKKVYGERGVFLGNKVLGNLLPLTKVAKSLGIFMAYLHYGLRFDGNDLEFIIGNKCGNGRKIFVIDFGMVKKIEPGDYDPLESSLVSVEYFPLFYKETESLEINEGRKVLIKIFKKAYISTAEKYGYKQEAEKVYNMATNI